jgi:hypothetical protein
MKTSFRVVLMNKDTMEGKEVVVQAGNKLEAHLDAISLQHFPNKWTVMTVKVDADKMVTKFKHKGVRYSL